MPYALHPDKMRGLKRELKPLSYKPPKPKQRGLRKPRKQAMKPIAQERTTSLIHRMAGVE